MQFAISVGQRAEAKPGLKGRCPTCHAELVPKCGPRVIWHWAHRGLQHCDPWWENETEWHREWKALFPSEWHEVLRTDPESGEVHIADVMAPTGFVVEVQNSPMPQGELFAREAFYGTMIWIVNAAPFKEFSVLGKLPDPNSHLAQDVVFVPPHRNRLTADATFWRKSENLGRAEDDLVEIHSVRDIADEVEGCYRGHHMFHWGRPRKVWFDATHPVFLHPGGEVMLRLMRYPNKSWCVQMIQRDEVVRRILDRHGASPPGAV